MPDGEVRPGLLAMDRGGTDGRIDGEVLSVELEASLLTGGLAFPPQGRFSDLWPEVREEGGKDAGDTACVTLVDADTTSGGLPHLALRGVTRSNWVRRIVVYKIKMPTQSRTGMMLSRSAVVVSRVSGLHGAKITPRSIQA